MEKVRELGLMSFLRSISGVVVCAAMVLATSFCVLEGTGLLPPSDCCPSSHQEQRPDPEHSESLCCELGAVRFLPVEEHTEKLVSVVSLDLPAVLPATVVLELSNSESIESQVPLPPDHAGQSLQVFLEHSRSPRAPAHFA